MVEYVLLQHKQKGNFMTISFASLMDGATAEQDVALTESALLATDSDVQLEEAMEFMAESLMDQQAQEFAPEYQLELESLFTFNQDRLAGISDETLADFHPDKATDVNNAESGGDFDTHGVIDASTLLYGKH